ncbi:hypothetical protein GCM10023321_47820 [Pseudonocardia eucalypti]|uniref:CBS domain-containing protein n=1 Tax=Pseudonocardia eucalypti TaxID=648755 RepID=A0ABP9QI65_9PSEU|nr:CBS domain-containing protein [Pseudonocardia eucalypti]
MSAGESHLAAPPETLDEDPRLRDLMTHRLVAITPDSDVHVALRLMVSAQVRHLPVMDGPDCLGVVFERDVLRGVLEDLAQQAHPVLVGPLRRPVPSLRTTDRRSRAAACMAANGLDAVLVHDGDHLIGIVTATDIIRSLARSVPGHG